MKVPGTVEGAEAVRQLIAEGINVNITLLFAIAAHDRVINAYIAGLEDRVKKNLPIDKIYSVASFFVSRVDSEIDKRLDVLKKPDLKGRAAIANAKLAYQLFTERFSAPRWKSLEAKGGRVQKPLWASTSTKNPAYRDVMYVEQLIGPRSINTMPPATIDASRDHAEVKRTVDRSIDESRDLIAQLESTGISMKEVTDKLLVDGLASFSKSFETLTVGLEKKRGLVGAGARG